MRRFHPVLTLLFAPIVAAGLLLLAPSSVAAGATDAPGAVPDTLGQRCQGLAATTPPPQKQQPEHRRCTTR